MPVNRWEYRVHTARVDGPATILSRSLTAFGSPSPGEPEDACGWEIFAVAELGDGRARLYMKRPVTPS